MVISGMPSGAPSSTSSPPMLTPSTYGYPDSKAFDASPKHVNEKERTKLDSFESMESVRPKFDSRKHSNESTDSAVDMRTIEEPLLTYHSFPFPPALPLQPKKESEVGGMEDPQTKSNGYAATKPTVVGKPVCVTAAAASDSLTASEKLCSAPLKPIISDSDSSVVTGNSLVVPGTPSINKHIEVNQKPTVIEQPVISETSLGRDIPILPEKPTVLPIVRVEQTLESSASPTEGKQSRTVVLLVEDNAINLKVSSKLPIKKQHPNAK